LAEIEKHNGISKGIQSGGKRSNVQEISVKGSRYEKTQTQQRIYDFKIGNEIQTRLKR